MKRRDVSDGNGKKEKILPIKMRVLELQRKEMGRERGKGEGEGKDGRCVRGAQPASQLVFVVGEVGKASSPSSSLCTASSVSLRRPTGPVYFCIQYM